VQSGGRLVPQDLSAARATQQALTERDARQAEAITRLQRRLQR
jgi:hypothetical protein